MIRALALLAAVLAAAFAVQGSQATFTATKTNAGSAFTTTANFPPAVTLTGPAAGATTSGTPTINGAAGTAAADSMTVNVKIYAGATATGTAVRTQGVTRTGATWTWTTTPALSSGTYTAQATQSDGVNTGTTAAVTFTVDAAKPTATRVLATNKTGGTAGKIESGDTITFTYSRPITAASVWSIWSGSTANVHVRFTNAGNNDTFTVLDTSDAATINLGSVATGGNYVSATTTFSSTMVRSADGASAIVTLGTPGGTPGTVTAKNMSWTVGAGITDLVGNVIATPANWTESVSTVDF
jgi:hypothetical protein